MIKGLVSIIVPYFNSMNYLNRLLDSVQNQRYTNFECILIDDGSQDSSFELATELIRSDGRFSTYRRPDSNLPGGRGSKNFGFKLSQGEYTVFFDSDDVMHPNFISERVYFLNHNLKHDAVITDYNWKVQPNKPIRTFKYLDHVFIDFPNSINTIDFWLNYMDYKFYFPPGNAMYRRAFIENKSMWNENTGIGEDHEYHARLFLQGLNLGHISKSTFDYMYNSDSMISTSETPNALYSRAYGKMLVLENLIVHFKKPTQILEKEFICQTKILRRVVLNSATNESKRNVIMKIYSNLDFILSKSFNSNLRLKFKLYLLKCTVIMQMKIKKGFILYNFILKDYYKTFDNSYFIIEKEN